jgi:hypothetical protein
MTIFIRLLNSPVDAKAGALRESIQNGGSSTFHVAPTALAKIPGSPFAYWVLNSAREAFAAYSSFEDDTRTAVVGLQTSDNFRFCRLWWETDPGHIGREQRWIPYAKGGSYSPFYADIHLLTNWENDGAEMKAWAGTLYNNSHWSRIMMNSSLYFEPGLTWPLRTSDLSVRALPRDCIFGHKGPAVISRNGDPNALLPICAVMASRAFAYLIEAQLARTKLARSYEAGIIQRTPLPGLAADSCTALLGHALRAWSLRRSRDSAKETSHAFTLATLLRTEGGSLISRSVAWEDHVRRLESELLVIQSGIDARCFDLYGIDAADRRTIAESVGGVDAGVTETLEAESDADADSDEADDTTTDATTLTADILSWAAGVAFGRFDIRLATGERPIPPEPEPFDPLPTHSPGMLAEPYPSWRVGTLKSPPAHLVDDPGHPTLDLTAAVRAVFDTVFGDDADARWREAAALLDPKDHEIRTWLARGFFEHHLKRYSKSRRKAPILWQLATASSRYAVWLYAHRATKDTFFQVQNDLVAPKLAHEERRQSDLIQAAGPSPSVSQRKDLDEQAGVVEELRTMLDEVKRIAPLWSPDLDDGIVVTMAPLWRLVPQHKAWQKELRAAWEALAAGKYDWAHLAMHLWPERVVPKCLTDRSLAIAHGLEDRLWVQDFDDKWRLRQEVDETIAHVVRQHRSRTLEAEIEALRTFWKSRFAEAGRSDAAWWTELETGVHDDAPLALAWWPRRVREKAAKDPALAKAHGLEPEQWLPDAERSSAGAGKRRKAQGEPDPRLSTAQLAKVAGFCGDLEGYPTWAARWQAWDEGAFDGRSPLSLPVRTEATVQRATEDHAVALRFGLERWFWLKTGEEVRRLGAPEAELAQALAERQSITVKAALKSLEEAPTVGAGAGKRGGGRRKRGEGV